ncbi:hypothetical protein ABB37_04597 [Leptomonas pyrrhocoris]|uniref:Uncharacterized protein n=1 Tax=Leptomonas pyrrhocoris TaxID=157538 RepID=A0A0M9G1K4_LEPPY|nr:hypothetical protein ABB37_04597 [Leptomonas pyrrhocoris]XP_015658756.1 hypothetical protein ABB37_04597 [Leptomonas pyrrhocoris]KPA80316.1 hypothetical protein ABB37_04597 [Leptomonas pyrrhocoris]KPA80317.1 hypothetical protein ABB37_04597 [Leptomonas pyrrhocoris]|eukprot:XP_015658755.1 hypothetical protein ABB37_04597 [Leptomonas pyrrhocoris]
MISFLVSKCGAEASELPQLVTLHRLLQEDEREGAAGASTAAKPVVQDYADKSTPHVVRSSLAHADNSMLGFLLDRCATVEEQSQCPRLQQMRGWLLQEEESAKRENADAVHEPNVPAAATRTGWDGTGSAKQREGTGITPTPTHERIFHRHHENTTTDRTPPLSPAAVTAAEGAPPAPAMAVIPVPILPGVGDWKGTITVLAPPPSPQTSQPARQPSKEGEAASVSVTEPAEGARKGSDTAVTETPVPFSKNEILAAGKKTPKHDKEQRSGPADAPPSGGAASSSTSPPPHPTLSAYAGRMPRPASEALAVRNSATVRLLSGRGVRMSPSNLSSPIPPASRPMSGFARRFMADLYERVSTPKTGVTAPLSPGSATGHATGSGVRAAREHNPAHGQLQQQRQQQRQQTPSTSLAATRAEAWHAGAAAGVRGATASRTGTVVAPPSRFTPVRPAGRRASDSEPRPRRNSLHRPAGVVGCPPSVVLPGVGAAARPVRPPSSAAYGQHVGTTSGCADPVGLMVVGAHIHLPSAPLSRSRYL